METANLTSRQTLLLKLIVHEHVQTASPVASRAIVENYEVGISSATVRSEMSKLEELGYLTQPHTSAGRVPTESGFRYFVERLMEDQTLSLTKQRMIAHQFYQTRDNLKEWMPLAASVLAHTSRGTALITSPHAKRARYKHLELINTHGRAVLLVLVLHGGTVEQQMLALPRSLTQTELSETAEQLNRLCHGFSTLEIKQQLAQVPALETDILQVVISLMQKVARMPANDIYHHGLPQLLQEPEFAAAKGSSAKLIRAIEENNQLRAIISDALSPLNEIGSIRVIIGGESKWDALRACSLVMTRYGVANYATGALGILGPIRMSYGRTISVVRFVASILNELVYDMYRPTAEDLPSTRKINSLAG